MILKRPAREPRGKNSNFQLNVKVNFSFIFRTGSGDSGLTGSSAGTADPVMTSGNNPPPRPLHRYPSWEDRILQVASEGLDEHSSENSKNNNGDEQKRNSFLYGNDFSVPVYATVKGVRQP